MNTVPPLSSTDTETVHTRVNQRWDEIYRKYFSHHRFDPDQKSRRGSNFSGHIIVLAAIIAFGGAIYLLYTFLPNLFPFGAVLLLLSLPILFVWWHQKHLRHKVTDSFTVDVQKRIADCVSDVLSREIHYTNAATDQNLSFALQQKLAHSMLIDHVQSIRHKSHFDDTYTIHLDETTITVTECSVHISQTTHNTEQNMKPVFQGYFATIELARTLEHKTFLATEKGAYGNDFSANAGSTPPPNATQLEWSEFNSHMQVSTTDETEARYIFTPDFMANLFDLWKNEQKEIRISFIDNKAYILWKDTSVHIGPRVKSVTQQQLFADVCTLTKKFLYLIHLAEVLPIHLTAKRPVTSERDRFRA